MAVYFFSATWCSACKAVYPHMKGYPHEYLLTDDPSDRRLADRATGLAVQYHVQSLPTILIVDHEGNELKRHSGAISPRDLKKFMEGK